ncbi:MAG TPA: NUDIX hydrolase, partial [Polyangiaceae bacterium]|nr:NUDIX hydrolase [Polyangiaceae bacterium]
MEPWKVRKSRVVLERRWLRIREEHVELPTGQEIEEFHVLEGPNWVGVLALTEDGRVILVDQYRHGIAALSRELPAGVIEPNESALEAARRELLEETGCAAEHWEPLIYFATEPARHTTMAQFFVARGARFVAEQRLDPGEHMSVLSATPAEVFEQIESGVI